MPYKDLEVRKLKQKEYAKKHYSLNKEKCVNRSVKNNIKTRINSRKYVNDYLLNHACVDCGESDPIVLEFDHINDNKAYNIADMIRDALSIKTIQEEIDKCEVRCANCHRRITHKRRIEKLN